MSAKRKLVRNKSGKKEIKVKSFFFLLNNFLFESAEKFPFYFEGFLEYCHEMSYMSFKAH